MKTNPCDLFLLFVYAAVELGFCCVLFKPLPKRWKSRSLNAALLAAVAGCIVLGVLSVQAEDDRLRRVIYTYEYAAKFYGLIFLFMCCRYRIGIWDRMYYLIVLFLCSNATRHLVGHMGVISGFAEFISGLRYWRRFAACALLFCVYMGIARIVKRYLYGWDSHNRGTAQAALALVTLFPCLYIAATTESLMLNVSIWQSIQSVLIECMASFCGLCSVLGTNWLLENKQREQDLLQMRNLLNLQWQQYSLRKETTELLNAKYHDIKGFLQYAKSTDQGEREALLAKLKSFESFQSTKNETLDIIITDKYKQCSEKNIRLIPWINGELLCGISPLDLISIFSNALDNAIEACEKLPIEQREIVCKVSGIKDRVAVHIDNPWVGDMAWKDGELASTKDDANTHGFGLRSIRQCVEKYGGSMAYGLEEGRFSLNIIFPGDRVSKEARNLTKETGQEAKGSWKDAY